MFSEILRPVALLACWTMVMWFWMYATRIPAIGKEPSLDTNTWIGGTGKDLDELLPARVQWIAQNYNHLHEAPTVFYAVCLLLAFVGAGNGIDATLAWGYVIFRILHSIVQVLINRVVIRFALFALSSLCLIGLCAFSAFVVFVHSNEMMQPSPHGSTIGIDPPVEQDQPYIRPL